jgi:glyoxylase-like metal-dependent hydrolase (beta-lactamase superfamily II)
VNSLRLTDRIYLIGGSAYGYSAPGDCNMYLVDCGSELALIDTGGGKGIPRVLENINRMGLELTSLDIAFITHCHYDHIGGNKDLKDATGCKIAAHELEKVEIETLGELTLFEMAREEGLSFEPTSVDMTLRGEQRVRVGDVSFKIIHTPGHTPGGISLRLEEDKVTNLFSGDTASAQGRLGYINGPGCDLKEWKRSIKKMLASKPDRLFPGHGVFVLSGAVDHLALLNQKMNAPWVNIVTSIG